MVYFTVLTFWCCAILVSKLIFCQVKGYEREERRNWKFIAVLNQLITAFASTWMDNASAVLGLAAESGDFSRNQKEHSSSFVENTRHNSSRW